MELEAAIRTRRSEHRLIHGIEMRPHRLIMPAAKLNRKIRQTRADPGCGIARFGGVIINMGVITFDDRL